MENLNLSFNLEAFDRKPSDLATIGEGTSYYRLLPPFGTNHRQSPFALFSVHWGFKDAEGNDTVVTCSYDTEKFCPICETVRSADDQAKALPEGSPDRTQREEYVKTFRADRAYYFNAVNQEGRVVKLKLKPALVTGRRSKANEVAENTPTLLSKLKEAVNVFKIDPLGLEAGVWFAFSRSGKGFNTTYSVDFKRVTTNTNGDIVQKVDTTKLEQQFPELYATLKSQLETGAKGPMFDIHKMYEPMTSTKLLEIMESGIAPSRRRSSGAAPQVGPLSQPPVAFTPKAEVAVQATEPTPAPVAQTVASAPAEAPVQAPVAAAQPTAPVAPSVSAAEARAKLMQSLKKS